MFCAQRNGNTALGTPSAVLKEYRELQSFNIVRQGIDLLSTPLKENLEMWNFVTHCFTANLSELDFGTIHLITFPVILQQDELTLILLFFFFPPLLQRLTPTTAGRRIAAALNNVSRKPRANTEHAQSFFTVGKVSSSSGWPDADWVLMVSEPAGWDETSRDLKN